MKPMSVSDIAKLGGDLGKPRFVQIPSIPSLDFVLNSAQCLLDDAIAGDIESEHDQRENWRLSHAVTVATFFGLKRSEQPEAVVAVDPRLMREAAKALGALQDAESRWDHWHTEALALLKERDDLRASLLRVQCEKDKLIREWSALVQQSLRKLRERAEVSVQLSTVRD